MENLAVVVESECVEPVLNMDVEVFNFVKS